MVFLSCIHVRSLVDGRMYQAHLTFDKTAYMDALSTTKLHVQVFLRMNT